MADYYRVRLWAVLHGGRRDNLLGIIRVVKNAYEANWAKWPISIPTTPLPVAELNRLLAELNSDADIDSLDGDLPVSPGSGREIGFSVGIYPCEQGKDIVWVQLYASSYVVSDHTRTSHLQWLILNEFNDSRRLRGLPPLEESSVGEVDIDDSDPDYDQWHERHDAIMNSDEDKRVVEMNRDCIHSLVTALCDECGLSMDHEDSSPDFLDFIQWNRTAPPSGGDTKPIALKMVRPIEQIIVANSISADLEKSHAVFRLDTDQDVSEHDGKQVEFKLYRTRRFYDDFGNVVSTTETLEVTQATTMSDGWANVAFSQFNRSIPNDGETRFRVDVDFDGRTIPSKSFRIVPGRGGPA